MKLLQLPYWLQLRKFYRRDLIYVSNSKDIEAGKTEGNKPIEVHPDDANLISSENPDGTHALFLDLDQEHMYTESTTKGHGHVYIDAKLTYDDLIEIIQVLAKHGIVQPGIRNQLERDHRMTLRPPWIKKDNPVDSFGLTEYKNFNSQLNNENNMENEENDAKNS